MGTKWARGGGGGGGVNVNKEVTTDLIKFTNG